LRIQTRSPKLRKKKNLCKSVSEEGKTWGGKDRDRGGGEKYPLETNEEKKARQDSEIVKDVWEKEWTHIARTLCETIKTKKKQEMVNDFKE